MGISTSPAQLAGKIDRFAKELHNKQAALNKVGMAGKRIFTAAAASGGALGKKPVGKRKIISAYYDIANNGSMVVIGYRGPIHLIANPTKPHDIYPRRPRGGRRRRGRGAQALTIGSELRASARHPGTRGKPFVRKAKVIAARELPPIFMKAQVTEPLKKAFH